MEDIAFVMKLKPGFENEYKKRHDAIWPELSQALVNAGILDYKIYLHEPTGLLFAWQRRKSDHSTDQLPELPIMKKWWLYMADIMDTHPDHSPVAEPLKEVFRFSGI